MSDLVGQTFNRLTVIGSVKCSGTAPKVECKCACGSVIVAFKHNVVRGATKSCGCLAAEWAVYRQGRLAKLSATRLRELLDYDHETGHFFWKIRINSRIGPGHPAGTIDRDGYTVIRVDHRPYKAHRLAWLFVYDEWPKGLIDHKDRSRSNNAIANLRVADVIQNGWNKVPKKVSETGVTGVYKSGKSTWRARIWWAGRTIEIGAFETVEDARKARRAAELRYFGEFATK